MPTHRGHFQILFQKKETAQTSPAKHYARMTLKDIENLPIGDLADTDCAIVYVVYRPIIT